MSLPAMTQPARRPNSIRYHPGKVKVERPALQVVSTPVRKVGFFPIWGALIVLLIGAMIAPMYIQTQMSIAAYEMKKTTVYYNRLTERHSALVTMVEEANSPQAVSQRAKEIGLVPANTPGIISLQEGSVQGGKPAQ